MKCRTCGAELPDDKKYKNLHKIQEHRMHLKDGITA